MGEGGMGRRGAGWVERVNLIINLRPPIPPMKLFRQVHARPLCGMPRINSVTVAPACQQPPVIDSPSVPTIIVNPDHT